MAAPMRLFVALYPPEDARRAALRALQKLDPPPDARHRACPLEQVHMTVHFIGDTAERELDRTLESVQRSAAGLAPFDLAPLRLVTLPERGRPRLIALETDAPPTLLEIQRRLVQRLARSPRARTGDRFRPHLTLCRFTASANPRPVDAPVSLPAFRISELVLMRSILRPTGAEHLPVAAFELSERGP